MITAIIPKCPPPCNRRLAGQLEGKLVIKCPKCGKILILDSARGGVVG
jgi:predicted RNA-binding Zn-ribbon protein involved in translation (DUF1610 family)